MWTISPETKLFLLPLLVTLFLVFGLSMNNARGTSSFKSPQLDEETCECPDFVSNANCADQSIPVLGGVDFVTYFTKFKISEGVYNESETGILGNKNYQSIHNGYTFYFISQDNKIQFDLSPSSYLPQWGGFCSWGISDETCPTYPWAKDCLGPSGNWGHWTIQQDRLFFFLFDEAKTKFMADPDLYIAQGDERWSTWYSPSDSYFSTKCYVAVVSD